MSTTPKEFCSYFEGVLAMAEGENGAVTFTKAQTAKISAKLKEALQPLPTVAPLESPFGGHGSHARC